MKRSTPMKRTAFHARDPKPRAEQAVKPPKCKHCRKRLDKPGQKLHDECVAPWWAANSQKVRVKAERVSTKARKEAVKRLPDLHREAQRPFNQWVLLRDAALPCISCGAPPPDLDGLHAGRDAGHYRSIGSSPGLRYNEDNVHGQCVHCNQWGSGKAVEYRIGLIARIGLERVEALECSNAPHKWKADELRLIRDEYRQKARELKKAREA